MLTIFSMLYKSVSIKLYDVLNDNYYTRAHAHTLTI